jgi:DNA-binding transcriptional regulator GbsR (MarR family)
VSEAAAAFVADVAARLAAEGFPRIPAGVLMALMASEDGRLGTSELMAELGVSAAAVSGAVKYLGVLGFVRTVTAPGSRRHVYALPDTPWYTQTLTGTSRYRDLAGVLEAHAEQLAGSAAARVGEMADFFRFLDERMPLLYAEWREVRGGDDDREGGQSLKDRSPTGTGTSRRLPGGARGHAHSGS